MKSSLLQARVPLAMNIMVEPGSYLVERYSYEGPKGGKGRQWVVHRVERDGSLTHLIVCDTRREAAEYVAKGKL